MSMLHKRRNIEGFSLLEILVAFSIAGVTLGLLYQVYARGMSTARLGDEYASAVLIAESKLAEYSVTDKLRGSGDSGQSNSKYQWSVSIDSQLENLHADWSLKKVTVSVTWKAHRKLRRVDLQTLKPAPAL